MLKNVILKGAHFESPAFPLFHKFENIFKLFASHKSF